MKKVTSYEVQDKPLLSLPTRVFAISLRVQISRVLWATGHSIPSPIYVFSFIPLLIKCPRTVRYATPLTYSYVFFIFIYLYKWRNGYELQGIPLLYLSTRGSRIHSSIQTNKRLWSTGYMIHLPVYTCFLRFLYPHHRHQGNRVCHSLTTHMCIPLFLLLPQWLKLDEPRPRGCSAGYFTGSEGTPLALILTTEST